MVGLDFGIQSNEIKDQQIKQQKKIKATVLIFRMTRTSRIAPERGRNNNVISAPAQSHSCLQPQPPPFHTNKITKTHHVGTEKET